MVITISKYRTNISYIKLYIIFNLILLPLLDILRVANISLSLRDIIRLYID